AQLGIVALQANHHRHLDVDFFHRADDALGNHVATHDAAEDVHQHGLHIAIGKNDLEGFADALLGRATAHIQEVGRLAAMQIDDVHGAHGQAGTVDHAANVAIQRYIV